MKINAITLLALAAALATALADKWALEHDLQIAVYHGSGYRGLQFPTSHVQLTRFADGDCTLENTPHAVCLGDQNSLEYAKKHLDSLKKTPGTDLTASLPLLMHLYSGIHDGPYEGDAANPQAIAALVADLQAAKVSLDGGAALLELARFMKEASPLITEENFVATLEHAHDLRSLRTLLAVAPKSSVSLYAREILQRITAIRSGGETRLVTVK